MLKLTSILKLFWKYFRSNENKKHLDSFFSSKIRLVRRFCWNSNQTFQRKRPVLILPFAPQFRSKMPIELRKKNLQKIIRSVRQIESILQTK